MNNWKYKILIPRNRENFNAKDEGKKVAKELRLLAKQCDENLKEELLQYANRFSRSVSSVKQYDKNLSELYCFADISRIWIAFTPKG